LKDTFWLIFKERGIRGFYKGYLLGAVRGFSFMMVQFLNDKFKKALGGNL
jgi:hypothetical protein